jgi:general secretion pathway protein D
MKRRERHLGLEPRAAVRGWRHRRSGVVLGLMAGGLLAATEHASVLAQQSGFPAIGSQSQPAGPVAPQAIPIAAGEMMLQTYDVPSEMVGAFSARLLLQFGADPRVQVSTEPRSGRLMVFAPEAVQAAVADQVAALRQDLKTGNTAGERGLGEPVRQQRSYKLRRVSAGQLEQALRRLAGSRLIATTGGTADLASYRMAGPQGLQDVLQVDRRRDEVTLQGSSASIAGWLKVVHAVDSDSGQADWPATVVPLDNADPRSVQRAVQLVRFAAKQDPDEIEAAAQLLGELFSQDDDETAMALDTLEGLGAESGLFGEVQIEFVPELGLVIVKGSKRDVTRVLEVIEQIKQQSTQTQPTIEVSMLKHTNSEALATIVREIYEQVLLPRQGPLSITPLVQPNALLLIGREEAIASISELLEKLDQPLDPTSQRRVFRLLHASAIDAQQTIRQFFAADPEGGNVATPRAGLGVRVKVVADYRTNSLIVQAAPRDMGELARLIQDIDVESTPAESELRVFGLRNALAEELAPVLQAAITGQAQAQPGVQAGQVTPPSSSLSLLTVSDDTRGMVQSGILAGVVVTASPRNNSLLVRGPAASMPLIEALIKQLDQLPSAEAVIKVFTLRNGFAPNLASMLQQLFGLPVTAGQAGGLGGFAGLAQQIQAAALTAGGDSALVQLRIAVEQRTNSIIVSGSRSDLEVIEVLLLRLDEDGIQNRRVEVLWLRNNNAADVAATLNQYLQQQLQLSSQLLNFQALTVLELVDQQAFVVAEPGTNSLVISASPRLLEEIVRVVERLDRRPPMVHVQVLLAEVSLDDTFEFGAEWGLQDSLLFKRGVATGGTLGSPTLGITNTTFNNSVTAGSPGNLAAQGLATLGLGRSNSQLGYGGLVLSAASDSIGLLLRALQDANRLQILSSPNITTVDNVEAFVEVGQRVPRVSDVTVNQFGGLQTATADVPVGLLLRIQPRTNRDGLILMDVQVERSSLGPEATGVPVGFGPGGEVIRSPIINATSAIGRISAYSGQTVILGGLITKERATRSRRIPFLADIPIAGALFRFDSEQERRTELLVVLTPRVVMTDEDVEMVKQVETARMSWCLADVLNIHGDVGLSPGNGLWGPAASPVIYPDQGGSHLETIVVDGEEVEWESAARRPLPTGPRQLPDRAPSGELLDYPGTQPTPYQPLPAPMYPSQGDWQPGSSTTPQMTPDGSPPVISTGFRSEAGAAVAMPTSEMSRDAVFRLSPPTGREVLPRVQPQTTAPTRQQSSVAGQPAVTAVPPVAAKSSARSPAGSSASQSADSSYRLDVHAATPRSLRLVAPVRAEPPPRGLPIDSTLPMRPEGMVPPPLPIHIPPGGGVISASSFSDSSWYGQQLTPSAGQAEVAPAIVQPGTSQSEAVQPAVVQPAAVQPISSPRRLPSLAPAQ